jgi:hypothetical protein
VPSIPIHNLHRRTIRGDLDTVGALIDAIATPDDRLWPVHDQLPLKLDRGVTVGARGGHGPARYEVVAHQPRRWVRFEFSRPRAIVGFHEFSVQPVPEGAVFQHLMSARLGPALWVGYPVALRPLHNAVIERALDNAELAGTGRLAGDPVQFGRYVRLLLGAMALYQRRFGV